MATKKKRASRLGRGLSGLMGPAAQVTEVPIQPATQPSKKSAAPTSGIATAPSMLAQTPAIEPNSDATEAGGSSIFQYVQTSDVQPNRHQPRQNFPESSLKRLSDSIASEGVMQPIVVRPSDDAKTKYELIAGERRWRACQLAGLKTIPAIIKPMEDEQAAQWALIENLQREDLNPIDKAEAFQKMSESFGLSHAKIAERVGLERSTVTNLIRLLGLSDFARGLVREGILSMGQARAIAGLPDPDQQQALAQRVVREGLSVRQVESEVRNLLQSASIKQSSPTAARSAHLADLEKHLAEQLGTRVKIKAGKKKGSGSLAIDFYSLDEFDALLERMGIKAN